MRKIKNTISLYQFASQSESVSSPLIILRDFTIVRILYKPISSLYTQATTKSPSQTTFLFYNTQKNMHFLFQFILFSTILDNKILIQISFKNMVYHNISFSAQEHSSYLTYENNAQVLKC